MLIIVSDIVYLLQTTKNNTLSYIARKISRGFPGSPETPLPAVCGWDSARDIYHAHKFIQSCSIHIM